MRFGKPVIAIFNEQGFDVLGPDFFGDRQAGLPRNVLVIGSMNQPNWAIQRNFISQHQMASAILHQRFADFVWFVVVTIGYFRKALVFQLPFLFVRKFVHHQVFGKIRRRGGADKSGDALGPRQSSQQHNPATHGGSDQNLGAFGQLVEDGDRVVLPAPDGAVFESAGRLTVAEIIEPDKGLTAAATKVFHCQGFGSGHIGLKPGQKHYPWQFAGNLVVGDGSAIFPC